MATIQNESVIQGLSGKVGKQLAFHRRRDGQCTICSALLDNHRPTHAEAPGGHQRLYDALFCSNAAAQTQSIAVDQPHDIVSKADIIHPPEIHKIDISTYTGKAGESIEITAGDDVNVASVGVLIVTEEGILVEKGSAIFSDRNPYRWTYATTATAASRFVKIIVDVADVAPKDQD